MFRLIEKIRDKIELALSNQYTVGNYFRRKGSQIGKNNRIFVKYLSSEPYLVRIGDNCAIAEGVKFITHDGAVGLFRKEIPNINIFGKIDVKDNCFIGMDCIILPNVSIGPNSVVGAGSVVTKDVPPNTVVVGVPARAICTLEEYKQKCIQRWKMLDLKGTRDSWEQQLRSHFWKDV